MSASEIKLNPKDILFEEGDQSKSLYFIKTGSIRIFKRKAEGSIEIETLRAGQVVGELAFFDGNPRSASAEALVSTQLIEISKGSLDEALSKLPEWLVTLTKTISSRLRAANNRIRVLESLSTEYEVDKYGNRSKEYTFINTAELLKFSTCLLTIGARYGKNQTTDGIEFNPALIDKFASQIFQVPTAKVISLIELFKTLQLLKGELILTDIKFIDQFVHFLNEQNLTAHEKRKTLSENGFKVLSLIIQNRTQSKPSKDNLELLNIGPAIKAANLPISFAQELLDQNFVKNILLVSGEEVNLEYDPSTLLFLYRAFSIILEIDRLNEQKRKV